MLKINSDAFSFTLFDGLCHYTTLPKSSRANQDKMICTMNELADIFHFVYSVCEVICIHDCTVFKGILHITTFFVTTFFVVGAKVRIFFETKKKMARNFDIFQSWGAKMTFAPSYSFTLEGADEEDSPSANPSARPSARPCAKPLFRAVVMMLWAIIHPHRTFKTYSQLSSSGSGGCSCSRFRCGPGRSRCTAPWRVGAAGRRPGVSASVCP